jgi:hypothetical protein
MSIRKGKSIDYLTEDQPLPGQKYALISIVGPNMRQKCDVWGLKVRGVADSLENAKALTKRIMRVDKDYDIYTVDVGKFFPLAIEPYDISNVEYENEQLNELVKNYLENKEKANEHWHQRKQEMMKEAIREGRSDAQAELANKKEHPIAVLQRIKKFEMTLDEEIEKLESLKEDLKLSKEKFETYTQEERDLADTELRKAIENNVEVKIPEEKGLTIEEIRNEIMQEFNETNETNKIDDTLSNLKSLEDEIKEIETNLESINKETSPSVYNTLSKRHDIILKEYESLKSKLNEKDVVNSYINKNYVDSKHNNLFE